MNTIKFDITFNNQKDFDFVINKQRQYSYAFKSLYSNFNKVSDKEFTDKIRTKFKLSPYELNCLKIEVTSKVNAVTTIKANTDKLSKYLTNKRKFEIGNIYKHLFNKVKYYKCAYFVIEELNFKTDNKNEASKEANRKVKTIWNRIYQYNLINKHCNVNGIKLIEVNPCYSSFIGNMMYQYFDPSNSAIEIGRRGMIKYVKGKFYPKLTVSIVDTALNRLGLTDVQFLKTLTWVSFFNMIKETKVKYRFNLADASEYSSFSKSVNKTKWNIYSFV